MHSGLYELRRYLQAQYAKLYGQPDWQFSQADGSFASPTWIWQTVDLTPAKDEETAHGCAVLDGDIGLCAFFQFYDPKIPAREQVLRALHLRSNLQPRRARGDQPVDKNGAWRIALHWLVERHDFAEWIADVAEIREQTTHFEEVPADAIVAGAGDWAKAIKSHRVPRLLFRLRSVLKKKSSAEVDDWQSADRLVLHALTGFDQRFFEPVARECAREVANRLATLAEAEKRQQNAVAVPAEMKSVLIQNFRNIDRLDLQFGTPQSEVESTVIQGPNGSGKSSVYEALCIAVAKASERYTVYLGDRHRRLYGNKDVYVTDYLRNLAAGSAAPRISLNGGELGLDLAPAEQAPELLRGIRGTFLSQDSSRSFISMSATELGGEVASGMSTVAEDVLNFVANRVSAANEALRSFNARWGLRANVTRRETVLTQIADRLFQQLVPSVNEIVAWLQTETATMLPNSTDYERMAALLVKWRSDTAQVIGLIANELGEEHAIGVVQEHLSAIRRHFEDARRLLGQVMEGCRDWQPADREKLVQWGDWVSKRRFPAVEESAAIQALREDEHRISQSLAVLAEAGRRLNSQIAHLDQIAPYVAKWAEHDPDHCPTCRSNVRERGGLSKVTAELRAELVEERNQSRVTYGKLRNDLQQVHQNLSDLGAAPPPVSAEEQGRLTSLYGWLVPAPATLELVLAREADRAKLLELISHVQRVPSVPVGAEDLSQVAKELVTQIYSVGAEHEAVSRLPEAWKTVQKALVEILSDVTAAHLPETIQALWQEIAKNIMPAAWQQPGELEFATGTRQGAREASITLRGEERSVLASHILNGAEVHNLGLAWFFVKYLLAGRFRYHFMVLDDPADTMDQATFRDLCRFLETLKRLHRIEGIPLSLIVLLHQDDRALDVARATNAVMYLLRWNKRTKTLDHTLRVYGEQTLPPMPTALLHAS